MSDEACFAFLKSINRDKQYFLDKGWTPKYYWSEPYKRWWPESFRDEINPDDNWIEWFPPSFKLVEEGFDDDKGLYPKECCINCKNSKGKYSHEHAFGCRLPEVRVANDSSVLKGKDHVCIGHSNPVFVWDVKFAPHAVCDYFDPMGYTYNI